MKLTPLNTVPVLLCMLLAGAMLTSLTGCGRRSAADRKIVTVSIPPQKYILEQIAGDRYDVRCLMASGGDPESYEPSFSNLLNTESSLAYMALGGLPFEDAVIRKIRNSSPGLDIFNTSEGIDLIYGTHGEDHADPHVWASVANVRVIAANMLKGLKAVDPEGAEAFEANYERFSHHLDSIDGAIRGRLAAAPGAAFAVWHPALAYFARDYGLRQVSVGGHEHKESSATAFRERLDDASIADVRVFLVQQDLDRSRMEGIARQIGNVPMATFNLLDYDWENSMLNLASAIADGKQP